MVKEVKLIRRYLEIDTSRNTAAGVYSSASTHGITPKFNITIVGLHVSCLSVDNVTAQAIGGQILLEMQTLPPTNPALVSSLEGIAAIIGSAGRVYSRRVYFDASANTQFVIRYGIHLDAVTANLINNEFHYAIEYLIPEDYLSINEFQVEAL